MTGKIITKDDGTGSKVVEGGAIQFGPTSQLPDSTSLEQTVQTAGATQNNQSGIQIYDNLDEAMKFLSTKLRFVVNDYLNVIAQYIITLNYTETTEADKTRINLSPCPVQLITSFLELPENYGPEISQSGIYETLGLDKKARIQITDDALKRRFPEVSEFVKIEGKDLQLTENPYICILSKDIQHRSFLTAATKFAEENNLISSDSKKKHDNYYKPLTLKHFLPFAKSVGEVPMVAGYLEIYEAN